MLVVAQTQDGACARTPRCHELPAARRRPRHRGCALDQQWRDKRCALCCLILRSASRPVPRDQQTGAQELPEEAAAAAAANPEQVNAQLEASGESTLTFDDVCFDAKRRTTAVASDALTLYRRRNAGGDRRARGRRRRLRRASAGAAASRRSRAADGRGYTSTPCSAMDHWSIQTTRRASALAAGAAPAERSEAEGLETAAAAAAAAAAAGRSGCHACRRAAEEARPPARLRRGKRRRRRGRRRWAQLEGQILAAEERAGARGVAQAAHRPPPAAAGRESDGALEARA